MNVKYLYICTAMARNANLQQLKKQKILEYFKKLDEARENGAKKYTVSYCINTTAEHFYLRPKTIENYLYS